MTSSDSVKGASDGSLVGSIVMWCHFRPGSWMCLRRKPRSSGAALDSSAHSAADVRADIDRWLKLYPRIQGVLFDEMVYEDTEAAAEHQAALNRYAREVGCWPTVANPGCDTPGRYFAADGADVIVVHEGNDWPAESQLKGDYFGGYADYPPFTRAVLVHSLAKLDPERLAMVRKYARWVYVTDDPYRPGDAKADNPWDRLSAHLEKTCAVLSPQSASPDRAK